MILLAAAALVAVFASPTPSPAPAAVEVETATSHETLTNGRGSWNTQYLRLTEKTADRQSVYVQLSSNSRFGKNDDQILLGAYVPLSERWMANVEADASNTHYVLPADSLYAGVQYASGGAFFEGLGLRHTDYDTASVNSAIFSLEHYWRDYRVSYSLSAANLGGWGTDVEHSAQFDRYYGKYNSSLGVGYTIGREVDNVGLPQLVTSGVHGWSLNGRHWMNGNWALVYGAGTFTQGAFYSRTGGRLGLDYRF
jgi:YaiO family outer membrane protein